MKTEFHYSGVPVRALFIIFPSDSWRYCSEIGE